VFGGWGGGVKCNSETPKSSESFFASTATHKVQRKPAHGTQCDQSPVRKTLVAAQHRKGCSESCEALCREAAGFD
jgi:hypothetical protein